MQTWIAEPVVGGDNRYLLVVADAAPVGVHWSRLPGSMLMGIFVAWVRPAAIAGGRESEDRKIR